MKSLLAATAAVANVPPIAALAVEPIPVIPALCTAANIPVVAPPYSVDWIVAAKEPATMPPEPKPTALRTNGAAATAAVPAATPKATSLQTNGRPPVRWYQHNNFFFACRRLGRQLTDFIYIFFCFQSKKFYSGMKSFSFLCRQQRIVGQNVSNTCWMSALRDCSPSPSCLLLREYWNLRLVSISLYLSCRSYEKNS